MFWFLLSSALATPFEAGSALRRGDCTTAVSRLPKPQENAYKLAIGQCYVQKKKHKTAAAMLDSITGSYQPYAQLLAARSNIEQQQYQQAFQRLRPLEKHKHLWMQASFLHAKGLILAGQSNIGRQKITPILQGKRAFAGYRPFPGDIDPGEIRWLLALSHEKQKQTKKAVRIYWQIWTDNPNSSFSERAKNKIIEHGYRIPDSTTEAGRYFINKRATTLRKLQQHKESLALLNLLPQDNTQENLRKLAYYSFQAKDYERSVRLYAQLYEATPEEQFHHALAMSRTGDYQKAAHLYTQLYTQFPQHHLGDKASFKIGYLHYDKKQYDDALSEFLAHLRRYPQSAFAADSRWFIAWALLGSGQPTEAKLALQKLIQKTPQSSLVTGATFWLAMLEHNAGNTQAAQQGFRNVLKKWPTSGYAWFAANRTNATFPYRPLLPQPKASPKLRGQAFTMGIELAEVGFEGWARQQLRTLLPLARRKHDIIPLAHALIKAGDYNRARKLIQPFCLPPWKKGQPIVQQACYPQPHGQAIGQQLQGGILHPLIPFAIMNAESNLIPWAQSNAGAFGLMQLMPEVGKRLHDRYFPLNAYDPNNLFAAGYNSTLGVAELQQLANTWQEKDINDHLPLIIASYNAGPTAVRRWLYSYPELPSAEQFSEEISYSETRRYVRRVLSHLMTYLYVYGEQ